MTEGSDSVEDMVQSLQRHYDLLEKKKDEFYAQADSLRDDDYYTMVTAKTQINSMGFITGYLAFITLTEMAMLQAINEVAKDAVKVEDVRAKLNEALAKHDKGLKWLERFQTHTPDTEKVD